MLLTPLSNVGVVDLEICFPFLGTFHLTTRYFNIRDRSEVSVGRVPDSMMLEMLEIFKEVIAAFATTDGQSALFMVRDWRHPELGKKDSWLTVDGYGSSHREGDGRFE